MGCLVCGNPVETWVSYGIPPRTGKCPHCGSKPRSRLLAWFFENDRIPSGRRILEIGPNRLQIERIVQPRFLGDSVYTAVDRRRLKHHERLKAPHSFRAMDATRLEFEDGSFDIVLCNHVLSYIPDDRAALSELRRVLKEDGMALLNTPLSEGRTRAASELAQEDPAFYTPAYFEENGTAWSYGEDFFDRLSDAGFLVHRQLMDDLIPREVTDAQAFTGKTEFIFAFRSEATREKFRGRMRALISRKNRVALE